MNTNMTTQYIKQKPIDINVDHINNDIINDNNNNDNDYKIKKIYNYNGTNNYKITYNYNYNKNNEIINSKNIILADNQEYKNDEKTVILENNNYKVQFNNNQLKTCNKKTLKCNILYEYKGKSNNIILKLNKLGILSINKKDTNEIVWYWDINNSKKKLKNNFLNISTDLKFNLILTENGELKLIDNNNNEIVINTTIPNTTIPNTTIPNTTIPNTTIPNTTIPNTTIPNTTIPNTTIPNTTIPKSTILQNTNSYNQDLLLQSLMTNINKANSKNLQEDANINNVLNRKNNFIFNFLNNNKYMAGENKSENKGNDKGNNKEVKKEDNKDGNLRTNIYQTNFKGNSNVYSPYLYYNKNSKDNII